MNKAEFLAALRSELEKQSVSNIDNMIDYYDEMICDRVEDGMTEEEAINSMDSIASIVREAVLDKTIPTLVKEKVVKSHNEAKKNGHAVLWIVLAIIGFPVWLPLVCVFATMLVGIFILMWGFVIILFSLLVALIAAALGCLALPFFSFSVPSIFMCLGSALILGGLAYLLWKPIKGLAMGLVTLIKDLFKSIKKLFV